LDKKDSPFLSIIIPTKDREEILSESLVRIHEILNKINFEVIVVNDSNKPLEFGYPKVRITSNPGHGVAAARNHGASLAMGKYFIFMDDDMILSFMVPEAITHWSDTYNGSCVNANWVYPKDLQRDISNEKFGRFLNHFGFTSLEGWHKDHFWDAYQIFEVKSVTSQFLWMSREVFQKIGGYNDKFPFAGFEDYDLAKKLNKHEVSIFIDPLLMVEHNERDRATDIHAWMARRQRGGKTRRVAVELGHQELTLKYGWFKSAVYQLISRYDVLVYYSLNMVPNQKKFDKISFLLINILYGASVYRGYFQEE
jgi:glycosyltransferase involved in cell wall biosynthesis